MKRLCLEDYLQENKHLLQMGDAEIIRYWVADTICHPDFKKDFKTAVEFWSKQLQNTIQFIRTGKIKNELPF